jgi:O-antigen/teichoic acid export membrane protein
MSNPDATQAGSSHRIVARNTIILMLAQVLGLPLAVLTNVLMGRKLGPEDYGQYYTLTTFVSLAFLFVEWGQGATLPSRIANDRPGSGRYLGSILNWYALGSLLASLVLLVIFYARGHRGPYLLALELVCLGQALVLLVRLFTDAVRGFERTKHAAYAQVATQLLTALLVLPVLLLGGRLIASLVAIAAASLVVLWFVWRSLPAVGIGRLSADKDTAIDMLRAGTSFLMLGLVQYLQPTIDAWFLNRYASPEAIGWYAAARKLINPLIFPANAMIGALYPTLCRLWVQSRPDYLATAQGTLRASMLVTVPMAVGCAMFADIGVLLYSREAYGPVRDNLHAMAPLVLLLYLSMVLGTCLNAAGRERPWTTVLAACLLINITLEPFLVPWFQAHTGNGGLGANIATALSELVIAVWGFWMLPRGILTGSVVMSGLKSLLAGLAMAVVAWLLTGRLGVWAAAPISLVAYGGVLYLIGGIDGQQLAMIKSIARRGRS